MIARSEGAGRTFLRGKGQVWEVRGQAVLGRSSRCDVVIDDELASREHCRVAVEGERVVLRDLGSRNGVRVNGERVEGELELRHGDVIAIGLCHLVLLRQREQPSLRRGSEVRTRPQGAAEITWGSLAGLTRRALDDGDLDAAEVSCRAQFEAIRAAAAVGHPVEASAMDEAVEQALELAERCADGYWLDQVLAIHLVASVSMSERVALRITQLAEEIAPPTVALEDYLAATSRIEGLSGRTRAQLLAAYCLRGVMATGEAEAGARAWEALRASLVAEVGARREASVSATPREVLAGDEWLLVDQFDRGTRRYVVACRSTPGAREAAALTEQEQRVAAGLAGGAGNKEIAYEIGLSVPRVANIVRSVKRKLGVRSRSEAVTLLRWVFAGEPRPQ